MKLYVFIVEDYFYYPQAIRAINVPRNSYLMSHTRVRATSDSFLSFSPGSH